MARAPSSIAHEKVLKSVLELVADHGIDATSMDAVARRSGVSKATIYKHWADKEALMLEMLAWVSGLNDRPAFDSGNIRADIVAVLAHKPKDNSEWRERVTPHIVSYGAAHPAFGLAWRQMMMEPPRRELRRLIDEAVAAGELVAGLDMDAALALLLGPVLYWHIFRKNQKEKADVRPLATAVVDAFWAAFGTGRRAAARRFRR
jgi:AcrR family transcriptional regulator